MMNFNGPLDGNLFDATTGSVCSDTNRAAFSVAIANEQIVTAKAVPISRAIAESLIKILNC